MRASMMRMGVIAGCLAATLFLGAGCDDDDKDDPCEGITQITLRAPNANETLVVGQETLIEWCTPEISGYGVTVEFSADGGETYNVAISTGEAVFYPTKSITWTPSAANVTTTGYIKVANYQSPGSEYDVVGPLVIAAQ